MTSRAALRVLALLVAASLAACGDGDGVEETTRPPNIVWIVADDMSFEIGAYGDPLARTPNLDRLAGEGVRYRNAFATAGVCAPSRATLITGMYATSIGAHHMRSADRGYQPVPPPAIKTFTEYLRAAGYYTSSTNKLDYQFSGVGSDAPLSNWDDPNGDWRGRAPGQPFFAYINLVDTHEIQLFADTSRTDTDPARVNVPPYYPDTELVRRDFARHYDNVARLDARVGEVLARLEEDGVAEDTVVFFFADNGRPLPRDKRWVYDGGIHLPLIVRWPAHLPTGATEERLVSYIDLAPTVLALARLPVPAHLPGRVFLGPRTEPPPPFVFAASDRLDEAEDRIRAVRDARFKYLRNYHPQTPYGQTIRFRDRIATMQEIHRLHAGGSLAPPADWYYLPAKPDEELYDTLADPFELTNLAERPEFRAVLARMRAAHQRWLADSGDLGAIAETELAERYWTGGMQPVTPPPLPSLAGGAFPGPIEVSVAPPIAGASIAYTLDPDADPHWLLYAGPIRIAASATLRLRAVRYGWAESVERAASFTIGGDGPTDHH